MTRTPLQRLQQFLVWFRAQSLWHRLGLSLSFLLLSLFLEAAILRLPFCWLSGVVLWDTLWAQGVEAHIDNVIQIQLQGALVNFHEQVEMRAGQIAAIAILNLDDDEEFAAEIDPSSGEGAVALGKQGWIGPKKGR